MTLREYYDEIMRMRKLLGYNNHINFSEFEELNQKFDRHAPEMHRMIECWLFEKEEQLLMGI
jgi:hypothetical protein